VGFDSTAVASWKRGGVTDPKVVVNSTRYVSPAELVADVTVAPTADLARYDVEVAITLGAGRKKGSGVEKVEKGIGGGLFLVAGGMTLAGALMTESEGPQWVDSSSIFGGAGSIFVLSRLGHGDGSPNGGVYLSQNFAHTIAAGIGACTSDPADMTAEDKTALFLKLRHNPAGYPRDFAAQVDLDALGSGAGTGTRNAIRSAWKEPDGTLLGVWIWSGFEPGPGAPAPAVTKLSSRDYRFTDGLVEIAHARLEVRTEQTVTRTVPPSLICPNRDTVVVTWPW
jgi:hypothetical protein